MTTLEPAAEYGQLTRRGAERFLDEHSLAFEEALADNETACLMLMNWRCGWVGY